jgi:signal transduction histidine kinase
MNNSTSTKSRGSFSLRGLSIQTRLPLLICILLLCLIVAFSLTSYWSVRKAAAEMGKQRLTTLTEQLSSMLGQSAQVVAAGSRAAAANKAIKTYLLSHGTIPDTAARAVIERLRVDSLWIKTDLLNAQKQVVLTSSLPGVRLNISSEDILSSLTPPADSAKVGKLYLSGDTICYPVVATVSENNEVIGYLVRWRVQRATARSIEQLSQLLGDNATLYIGNSDGSLWTNLVKPISSPPVTDIRSTGIVEYTSRGGDDVIATARPLPFSEWVVVTEVSKHRVAQVGLLFIQWLIIIGSVLLAIGIFGAWIISRNITRPLNKLTDAASVISNGDYSVWVESNRTDELGQLAHAFNSMTVKVRNVQNSLERKVQKRTSDLEKANKELESFSYSVSHDLRAPLRIINGYTEILLSDYSGKLDDEGNRMLGIITDNAKKMGRLIDDLLNLSRLGRKELMVDPVDMNMLVDSVLKEQSREKNNPVVIVGELHDAECDGSLIRQVWINLISNAVKYSGKKENPLIEIGSEQTGTEIIYHIKDNGVGFDMQYAGKLFGVFQRLHKMTEYEGTGVGLALVQRIVSRHGGRVWAEAEVDKGATFYFSLPILKPNEYSQEITTEYDRL